MSIYLAFLSTGMVYLEFILTFNVANFVAALLFILSTLLAPLDVHTAENCCLEHDVAHFIHK